MKKVLAISGGGMRGIGSAAILALIEKYTGKQIYQTFDLISGTSTGSILACLAGCSNPQPASTWGYFYRNAGPRIFKRGLFTGAKWLCSPKYRQDDLQRELQGCVGLDYMDESSTKVMIPVTDANKIDAEFLKSWDDRYHNWRLWEAAAASSSAQTFFPAFKKDKARYIDGGNHTNNPSASALFEAARLWRKEAITLVSIGTGKQTDPHPLPDGGIASWAPLIFGVCSETQDDTADYLCRFSGARYFKFDFSMDKFPAMDDASRETLDSIEQIAIQSVAQKWNYFQEMINLIK